MDKYIYDATNAVNPPVCEHEFKNIPRKEVRVAKCGKCQMMRVETARIIS